MMRCWSFALAALAMMTSVHALAADGRATLSALLAGLPGEFDSLAHKQEDEAKGLPEELVHGWVNRSFTPIYAPEIGEHVMVATVRYNGADGMFDRGEFQVWTLSANEYGSVTMAPQGFRDIDAFLPISRDAAALSRLRPADLKPGEGAAGCPIIWNMEDGVLNGATDPATCVNMSSTMGIPLGWEWTYSLKGNELWLNYAGYNEAGEIVNGRADQLPWRLDRVM